jgi:hypothetical protein
VEANLEFGDELLLLLELLLEGFHFGVNSWRCVLGFRSGVGSGLSRVVADGEESRLGGREDGGGSAGGERGSAGGARECSGGREHVAKGGGVCGVMRKRKDLFGSSRSLSCSQPTM